MTKLTTQSSPWDANYHSDCQQISPFMEPEGWLPCSQGSATEPDASSPHPPTLFS